MNIKHISDVDAYYIYFFCL